MNKRSVFTEVLIRVFKKTKIRTFLLLIILLSFNSAAWFIYATKVENGIGAKIIAWNVSFIAGDTELYEKINFKIENIYPGMELYKEQINVVNNGESSVKLSYVLDNARILDNYIEADDNNTSDMILYSLANDYPFKIQIGVSKNELQPETDGYFYINVYWDYESGNDELDTYWGNKAYDYHKENNTDSIEINLTLSAVQKNNKTGI